MLEQYPTQVKLVYKNFPLRSHKFSRAAATAALAAGLQGKFWEFHDRLFQDYSHLNDEKIREIAENLGLDMTRFDADRKSSQVLSVISRDIEEAQRLGVRGTPTIYVNGRLLRNRSMEGFRQLIDQALAQRERPSR